MDGLYMISMRYDFVSYSQQNDTPMNTKTSCI